MFLILGMSSVLLTLETNVEDFIHVRISSVLQLCFSLKRTCSRYK
jgi:hypothetical protein